MLRKKLDEIQAQTDSEKQWWEKRRAMIQKEFMSELDGEDKDKDKAASASQPSEDEPVLVDQNTPSATPAATPSGGKKKKGKK